MDKRNYATLLVLAVMSIFVVAGAVSYLSNTVNAQVTTSSPIQLGVTATNASGDTVALDAVTAYSGETIILHTGAENKSHVHQAGKYTVTITPSAIIEQAGATPVSTYEVSSAGIDALSTENIDIPITFDPSNAPDTYALSVTYNAN